ncbi:MAG: hypothetical protein IKQ15_04705 [Kiritimatiellae bacterium]|nr:hypothetical protein [Kiritimatiellia bacterium]
MRFLRLQSTAFDCNRLQSIPRPLLRPLLLLLLLTEQIEQSLPERVELQRIEEVLHR